MIVHARDVRLISTPSSKYAHLPVVYTGGEWMGQLTACQQPVGSYDPYDLRHDRYADGKPPCPRCMRRLRHRIEWLAAFEESYLGLPDDIEGGV